MKVHSLTQASDLSSMDLSSWTVVVIDVVRASSTIATALDRGCARVIPVHTVEEAIAATEGLPREATLVGGERKGLKVPGFDLGNSPREYTKRAVAGKTLVFTTTNGTWAMRAAQGGQEVIVGAIVNAGAVVRRLKARHEDVLLVPVGRQGAPVLDDVVCAGMYVDRLASAAGAEVTGGARLAQMVYLAYRGRLLDALRESRSGRALNRVGLGDDLLYCARASVLRTVPRLEGDEIRLAPE